MTEITTSSISLTPLGLPGRLIIKQPDLTPDTHLLKIDIGVLSKVLILIASEIPVTSKSIILRVASGVTSRGPSPVPQLSK